MEPVDLLVPFFSILVINFSILIVWDVGNPLQWERLPVGGQTNSNLNITQADTYGACVGEYSSIYYAVLSGCNLIIALVALIQVYEFRKISTEYSENLWIGGSLISIVQVWLVGFPVLQLVQDKPGARFAVKTAIVILINLAVLLCIFLPKVGYLREALAEKAEESQAANTPTPDVKDIKDIQKQRVDAGMNEESIRMTRNSMDDSFRMSKTGIRLIHSSGARSEEVERMTKILEQAEERNQMLQDRLRRLTELLEQKQRKESPNAL